jgi:hypothetical protein
VAVFVIDFVVLDMGVMVLVVLGIVLVLEMGTW